MSSSNDVTERKRVSKVTISPVSSGSTNALIVSIRKISTEVPVEDIPKVSSTFKSEPETSSSPKKQSKHSKHRTMSDKQRATSGSSQTMEKDSMNSPPCLKHAAQNIGRKAAEVPSEKIKLCGDCSKSMLSYIFLVQDFLDSLAQEISGDKSSKCLQCIRQEVRDSVASIPDNAVISSNITNKHSERKISPPSEYNQSKTEDKNKEIGSDRTKPKRTSRAKGQRQETKRHEDVHRSPQSYVTQESQKLDFIYGVSPPSTDQTNKILPSISSDSPIFINEQSSTNQTEHQQSSTNQTEHQQSYTNQTEHQQSSTNQTEHQQVSIHQTGSTEKETSSHEEHRYKQSTGGTNYSEHTPTREHGREDRPSHQQTNKPVFVTPMTRSQPNFDTQAPPAYQLPEGKSDNFRDLQQSPYLHREEVDGIVSTLSNVEREIYDSARNVAGWEGLTEPSTTVVETEAFVTFCRNNVEAIGCLVVGTSLLLTRTSRKLCVLVSDGVSTAFRSSLSAVFHNVQYVRSLDSLGTTKLSLLEQPELGVTFDKLNIWRLTQYSKCVYLNPDTLVIQNCDELFCHDELSAVPDIGWPDCFNSGVFVFAPSVQTFWQLIEFAEKRGSYDGGDQGLLNSYFNSWSSDIHKKLSFIYNLMANVSYTYTPAFRQFGRNVKIVQFHGSFKPWHVKFFTNSGQVSPASPVHPTYVQFVHIWLKIFRISVVRLMSQEIQSYAANQEVICAVETLRFFPLPTESESEFFLTPPSVRVRLAELKLNRSVSLPISEARRRKSAEFPRHISTEEDTEPSSTTKPSSTTDPSPTTEPSPSTEPLSESAEEQVTTQDSTDESKLESIADDDETKSGLEDNALEGEPSAEKVIKKKKDDKNALPGAEVGDYLGMKAWEQGRMDYQGEDSSDNVIKRLQFLMSKPN